VSGERVDSLVRENVLLLKLDVEGFEPTAFQSSQGLLKNHRCVGAAEGLLLHEECCLLAENWASKGGCSADAYCLNAGWTMS
jgi:hypothetical protein